MLCESTKLVSLKSSLGLQYVWEYLQRKFVDNELKKEVWKCAELIVTCRSPFLWRKTFTNEAVRVPGKNRTKIHPLPSQALAEQVYVTEYEYLCQIILMLQEQLQEKKFPLFAQLALMLTSWADVHGS